MVTEQTQFSMAELHEFLKNDRAPEASSLNKREQAMDAFSKTVTGRDFEPYGGEDNVQRVRVLADAAKPEERRYEFVTKLPISALADKRRHEEAAAKRGAVQEAVLVFKVLLSRDPKKAAEYMKTEGYKVLDRLVVVEGLEMCKEALRKAAKASKPARAAKPQPKVQRVPKGVQRIPAKAIDAYEKALEQDRQNRIKAAKEAASNLRKKAS
jgi:hypothetical protein